jgi:hypothetical protein
MWYSHEGNLGFNGYFMDHTDVRVVEQKDARHFRCSADVEGMYQM